MKILVVDDDPEARELLRVFLEKDSYEVTLVENGQGALKKVTETEYSLVLLDVNLPDISGIEVLKKMHKLDANLPVMMITGFKEAEKVIAAFREGAVDCILKPFNFEYLKSNIPYRARKV
jgi:DNA-binding response OmpR family regulator